MKVNILGNTFTLSPHSKKGSARSSEWNFHVLHLPFRVLQLPLQHQGRVLGYLANVNMTVNGCLSLTDIIEWQPVQDVAHLLYLFNSNSQLLQGSKAPVIEEKIPIIR